MNKININIWGRDFELDIVYYNFPGEEITELQQETVEKIISVDFSGSLDSIVNYITEYDLEELNGEKIDNIFRYVMPKSILIDRDDENRVFAVMCDYKFDIEHGLAVVFENEKFKAVDSQDIIL